MLEQVRSGDVILIWKLDRLGRSLRHLLEVVDSLNELGVGLKSLTDPIDTTTSQGKLVFNTFASLAEFERDLIRERTMAGLEAARARERVRRAAKRTVTFRQTKCYRSGLLFIDNGNTRLPKFATIQISKRTLYKYLRHEGMRIGTQRPFRTPEP